MFKAFLIKGVAAALLLISPCTFAQAADPQIPVQPREQFGVDNLGVSWVDGSQFVAAAIGYQLVGAPAPSGYWRSDSSALSAFYAPVAAPMGSAIYYIQCRIGYGAAPSPSYITAPQWMQLDSGYSTMPPSEQIIAWATGSPPSHVSYPYFFPVVLDTYNNPVTMSANIGLVARKQVIRLGLDDNALIFGCSVHWKRQISPAPSHASFGDVATSSNYFQAIEALAASGITAGCGGGNFCPDNTLTRKEMAVFLAKALGL